MMRRIDLLPPSYAARRRQRRSLAGIVIAGLLLLALLIGYWVFLGMQVSDARDELAQVQAQNEQLQAQIDELQQFADLETEVRNKAQALQTVMAGDVDWPALLTELAMVVPAEIGLENLLASAGQTEGASPVGTETAAVDISRRAPFGRIQFTGNSLSMPGVAKWLIRLGAVKDFQAIFLNNATAAEGEGDTTVPGLVDFDNTIELNDAAASRRFEELEILEGLGQ